MSTAPMKKEDLKSYGAWIAPDLSYYVVGDQMGHLKSAIQIAVANKWLGKDFAEIKDLPTQDIWAMAAHKGFETLPYDILFKNGYYRVVFEPYMVSFESNRAPDPAKIAKVMEAIPDVPISTSSKDEYRVFKNLPDMKVKTGLEASVKDVLRSEVDPASGTTPQGQEEGFNAYSKLWIKNHCLFARRK